MDRIKKFCFIFNRIISSLLLLVDLEDKNGDKVNIKDIEYYQLNFTGILNIPKSDHINYIPLSFIRFSEPSIIMIKKILESVFKRIYLIDKKGRRIFIKGFRLKIDRWLRKCESLPYNIRHLISLCNCNCEFCYHKNNPLKIKYVMPIEEAKTRAKYFNRNNKKGIVSFHNMLGEYFFHPEVMKILEIIREKDPESPIDITTNGTLLSEDIIKKLSQLRPIYINVSLNSVDISLRKKLMKGKGHESILRTIELLKEYHIPFTGSIVAWYTLPLEIIEKTIEFLDKNNAILCNIFLPGITKFNYTLATVSNLFLHWNKVKKFYFNIRNKFTLPILLIPCAFWIDSIEATIDGVIKNSPAERKGLKRGDVIKKVNNKSIFSRHSFICEMVDFFNSNKMNISLTIKRDSRVFKVRFYKDELQGHFYTHFSGFPFGIVMADSVDFSVLKYVKKHALNQGYKKCAIFASPLMFKQIKEIDKYLSIKDYFKPIEIKWFITKNYFWGGNIILGDLLTVDDFINLILENKKLKEFAPDFIAIPSTFLAMWGRDYLGNSYIEIEKQTGYKIYLMPNSRIEV